jgi:hypothetical protein
MPQIPATRAGSELVSGRNQALAFDQRLLRKQFNHFLLVFHLDSLLSIGFRLSLRLIHPHPSDCKSIVTGITLRRTRTLPGSPGRASERQPVEAESKAQNDLAASRGEKALILRHRSASIGFAGRHGTPTQDTPRSTGRGAGCGPRMGFAVRGVLLTPMRVRKMPRALPRGKFRCRVPHASGAAPSQQALPLPRPMAPRFRPRSGSPQPATVHCSPACGFRALPCQPSLARCSLANVSWSPRLFDRKTDLLQRIVASDLVIAYLLPVRPKDRAGIFLFKFQ